jgi:hypothetical protein
MKVTSRRASRKTDNEDSRANHLSKKGRDRKNALELRRKTAATALITSSTSSSKKKQSGRKESYSCFYSKGACM